MALKDLAICLRRSDYSETSLVVRLLTRDHGQVSLLAKGVKRPKSRFGGAIDLLSVAEAVFILPRSHSASTLGTLAEWDLRGYYPLLRSDLLRHATAVAAAELVGRLIEELDPHPATFDATVELLESLQAGEPPLRRFAVFARVLLADVGLSPNVDRCVSCGRPLAELAGPLAFSPRRGGALCPACRGQPGEPTVRVSRGFRNFFQAPAAPLHGKLALEITRWVTYHVQNQLGRPLNSPAALESAIAAALAEHERSRSARAGEEKR